MWIGVLWAGLRVAMWITHVGGKFRHGLLEKGCGFFAYSWKLPAYSGAFLLTVDKFSSFTYGSSFLTYSFSFFTYSWSFLLTVGKCV